MSEDGVKCVVSDGNIKGTQQEPLLVSTETLRSPQPPTYEQATQEQTPSTPPAATQSFVVVTEPVAVYGPHPIDIQCPYCHDFCRTRLRYKPNTRTHLIALLLCLLQLYCCICVPYCMGSCMNVNHYCGMCDKYLGTYKR